MMKLKFILIFNWIMIKGIIDIAIEKDKSREQLLQKNENEWMKTNKKDAELYIIDNICDQLLVDKQFYIGHKLCQLLIEVSPDDASFHQAMANVLTDFALYLEEIFEYKLSAEQYVKSVAIDVNDIDSIVGAAVCFARLRDNDNAKMYFEKAFALNKDYCVTNKEYGRFLVDNIDPPDIEMSKKCFEKAIEGAKGQSDAHLYWYQYAVVLRDFIKDYDKSQECYLKSIELRGDTNCMHGSYGYLLYLMGKYDEAKVHIDIQLDYDKRYNRSNPWGQFYHGLINKKLGNDEIAGQALLKAVDSVVSKARYKVVMDKLKVKENCAIDYYNKFEQLLHEKFD